MWDLSVPISELIIRATTVFLVLFLLFKIWGKKHIGEMAPFDFVILLIMSEALQNSLISNESSITGGLIVVTTLMLLATFMGLLSYHFRSAEKFLEGTPKVLIRNGKLMEDILQKEKISIAELLESIRENGVLNLQDIALAMLEANGKISVIKKENVKIQPLQKLKGIFKPTTGGLYGGHKKEHT